MKKGTIGLAFLILTFVLTAFANAEQAQPPKAAMQAYRSDSYGAFLYDEAGTNVGILLNGVQIMAADASSLAETRQLIQLPVSGEAAPLSVWMDARDIAPIEPEQQNEFLTNTVFAWDCQLLSSPAQDSQPLDKLAFKERILVLGRYESWYYVYAHEQYGFVPMDQMIVFSTTSNYRNFAADMMSYVELNYVEGQPSGNEPVSMEQAKKLAALELERQFGISEEALNHYSVNGTLNVSHGIGSMWHFIFTLPDQACYVVQINTTTGEVFECFDVNTVESPIAMKYSGQ